MKKHGFWNDEIEEIYTSYPESGQKPGAKCTHVDGTPTRIIPNKHARALATKLAHLIKEKTRDSRTDQE